MRFDPTKPLTIEDPFDSSMAILDRVDRKVFTSLSNTELGVEVNLLYNDALIKHGYTLSKEEFKKKNRFDIRKLFTNKPDLGGLPSPSEHELSEDLPGTVP